MLRRKEEHVQKDCALQCEGAREGLMLLLINKTTTQLVSGHTVTLNLSHAQPLVTGGPHRATRAGGRDVAVFSNDVTFDRRRAHRCFCGHGHCTDPADRDGWWGSSNAGH
jgi:hypothetical protein